MNQAKQLKELQQENAQLKRMLADEMLAKKLLIEALHQPNQYRASTRPTTFLRLGIDFLNNLNYNNNLSKLTNNLAQFGQLDHTQSNGH